MTNPLIPPRSYVQLANTLTVRAVMLGQASGAILAIGALHESGAITIAPTTPKDHADIRVWLAEIEAALQAHEREEFAVHRARPPLSVVEP